VVWPTVAAGSVVGVIAGAAFTVKLKDLVADTLLASTIWTVKL
jgi:hypothetical protein